MTRALIVLILLTSRAFAADEPPLWAFPVGKSFVAAPPETGEQLRVPGSDKAYTLSQLRNIFSTPDWHPESHPPMPDVVAKGRAPKLWACGYCHYPTGQGRPESSSLAGLDAGYIVAQVMDIKSGKRVGSQPNMEPVVRMHQAAEAVSLEDLETAAEYFASLTYKPWIRVIETAEVPQTRIGAMFIPLETGEKEPLGQRIIEVSEDPKLTDLRDFAKGFVAYVPKGSIKRGQKLVKTGIGNGAPCAKCHGEDLRGLGPVPGLAGRSPSYMARQLYDMRNGNRAGAWSALMASTVTDMTDADMLAVAAYLAAQKP